MFRFNQRAPLERLHEIDQNATPVTEITIPTVKRAYNDEPGMVNRVTESGEHHIMSRYFLAHWNRFLKASGPSVRYNYGMFSHIMNNYALSQRFCKQHISMGDIQYADILEIFENLVAYVDLLPYELRTIYPEVAIRRLSMRYRHIGLFRELYDAVGTSPKVIAANTLSWIFLGSSPYMQFLARISMIGNFQRDIAMLECALTAALEKKIELPGNGLQVEQDVETSFKLTDLVRDSLVMKELGSGSYGSVSVCYHQGEKFLYILKVTMGLHQTYLACPVFTSELTCPFIAQTYAAFFIRSSEKFYLLMPYVPSLSLESYVTTLGAHGYQDEFERNFGIICAQLVIAFHALHRMGLAQFDVKPPNLVINSKGKVSIIDTDSCCITTGAYVGPLLNDENDVVRRCRNYQCIGDMLGSMYTRSPESFCDIKAPAGEWFSLGLSMYMMMYEFYTCNNFTPAHIGSPDLRFSEYDRELLMQSFMIVKEVHWLTDQEYEGFPNLKPFKRLVSALLRSDPFERAATFSEIRAHSYFSSIDFDVLYSRALNNQDLLPGAETLKTITLGNEVHTDFVDEEECYSLDVRNFQREDQTLTYISKVLATRLSFGREGQCRAFEELDITRKLGVGQKY